MKVQYVSMHIVRRCPLDDFRSFVSLATCFTMDHIFLHVYSKKLNIEKIQYGDSVKILVQRPSSMTYKSFEKTSFIMNNLTISC